MKYLGSKARFVKDILPIMQPYLEGRMYVEPFVGGANMIAKVNHPLRFGTDSNRFLIALLTALRDGWQPPETISKEEYTWLRDHAEDGADPVLVGYAGFLLSFGAKFFGGYVGAMPDSSCKGSRDRLGESRRNALKTAKELQGVELAWASYDRLSFPMPALIYCDPPYASTTGYKGTKDFDHNLFWQWCREKKKEGHFVFVSEYTAPEGVRCVWQKQVSNTLSIQGSATAVERLFWV